MKKTNDEKLMSIALDTNNIDLFNQIIKCMCDELKLNIGTIYNKSTEFNSINSYIYNILNKCKYNILRVYKYDDIISKCKKNIDNYIFTKTSDSYSNNQAGYNNGMINNTVEEKHIKYFEMIEENNNRIIQRDLLYKSLEENQKLLRDFIDTLPQENFKAILDLHFIEGMDLFKVSERIYLSYDVVRCYKNRALKSLSKILYQYLQFKNI